ncbi:MAG: hypothetical protein AABX44_01945 [Nanoarchaeota archaeon]|mgnify:FL=1
MIEKTEIYIIGFDKTANFMPDVFCAKKIKDLSECNVNLNAVFTKDFEKLPIVKRYCSKHEIETINLDPDEKYYFEIVRYNLNNPDKKNLVALVSEKIALRLNGLFGKDLSFNSHIV